MRLVPPGITKRYITCFLCTGCELRDFFHFYWSKLQKQPHTGHCHGQMFTWNEAVVEYPAWQQGLNVLLLWVHANTWCQKHSRKHTQKHRAGYDGKNHFQTHNLPSVLAAEPFLHQNQQNHTPQHWTASTLPLQTSRNETVSTERQRQEVWTTHLYEFMVIKSL